MDNSISPVGTQPTENPDFIRVICPLFAELHGFAVHETVPTIRKGIFARDANGFEIWVHSPKWNRAQWVSSSEYDIKTYTNKS